MKDDRPAVYAEDDKIIYRASSLGHCIRMLWAARNNMDRRPIPEPILKAMDEGTELESHILDMLYTDYGWTFADGPTRHVELNVGAWNANTLMVRGIPDEVGCPSEPGLGNGMQKHRPIDVKAFAQSRVDEFRSKGFSAFPGYAWQQTTYALGYESESFYMPIYNKDTKKIEEWSLVPHGPMFTREQIRERVITVEEYYESGTMPEECPADYACQYPYLHEGKEVNEVPDQAVVLLRGRIALSRRIATFTAARRKLDEAIAPRLQQDVTYSLEGARIQVLANPSRFNTAAAKQLLRDAGIDVEHDPDFNISGEGTHVRVDLPKPKSRNG